MTTEGKPWLALETKVGGQSWVVFGDGGRVPGGDGVSCSSPPIASRHTVWGRLTCPWLLFLS